VFSESEKQEMRELAASEAVREEFRRLKKYSSKHHPVNLDRYIQFLTVISRLNSMPAAPRGFVQYTQVKL
jgi:hypothetical protein